MNNSKFDFASDVVNIIVLVYDASGSMTDDVLAIRKANVAFHKDFSRFEEKGSIAIAKCTFAEYIQMSEFLSVDHFDVNYSAGGGTKLYEAIHFCASRTIEYYNEVVKRLNIRPRITFLVFSDGMDSYNSSHQYDRAKNSIMHLNSLDATTVFVAFRDAITANSGDNLGFSCTRNISTVQELISCLGTELSQSCKEQSKSAYSLKSSFFSKAAPTEATGDAETEDMLNDSFFDV